jgi:hypothetical protein
VKIKNTTIVGTIPKFNRQIVERGKTDTSNTQMDDGSLFWLDTGTSMKNSDVNLGFKRI